ncbi:unnamed protein product [Thelazia callipaeda]|uniref:DNA 3'-5' helicase n=1 Tax=Thelazia callipaeda TaxID=103827 RepID=A0A0N5D6S6_THECL|nr:unnamed protein product [Thelazia callipaeda]
MSESDQELVDAVCFMYLRGQTDFLYEDSKECSISDPLITMQSASSQNNSSIVREDALLLLKKFFGHDSFRPLQWTIIKNALDGIDQVVVMSTGFGKSVCYQLPSLYTKKLTIVISPLISLMNDQVENVSENNSDEQHSILESSSLRLLYITPEFALHNSSLLKSIRKNVCLLAVDEAHCVSQWGHEFRPNYRRLAEVRRIFNGKVPVMALTATATQQVKMDIVKNLELHQPVITCASLDRPNLYLSVRSPASLKELLNLLTNEDEKNGKHFNGSTIIYCSTRTLVNEIYDTLSKTGVKCARYHAGMSVVARRKAHENFVKDRITTMIATVAFGMGIDKPDVRNVIHYGAPKNIESYYQEIGRAGRDGCPSMCIVLYKDHDLVKHRLLLSHFGESVKNSYPRARCCDVCDKLINLENNDALLLLRAVEVFQGYTGLGKIIDFLKGVRFLIQVSYSKQFSYKFHLQSDAAEQRGVSEGTITSYFVNFVKNGLPIHLDAIDINKQHLDTVFNILRLKPIMEKLPENFIDYNRLKIIFGILEYEYGVTENSERSSCTSTSSEIAVKRNIPEWMKTHVAHSVEAKKSKKSNLFK